ncbi:Flavin-linked sulfhydryl oxidase of the mitochondrial IMS [Oleoguttula sp. CCFEE 5521]
MPITEIQFPILTHFLCSVESNTGMPPQPLDATPAQAAKAEAKQQQEDGRPNLPKGVVLGPDGKPLMDGNGTLLPLGQQTDKHRNVSPTSTNYIFTPHTKRLPTRRRATWTINLDPPSLPHSELPRTTFTHTAKRHATIHEPLRQDVPVLGVRR